jgi:tRNA-modifying protein YgfZ
MPTPLTLDGAAPLSHWGLIRAHGADAVKFLQGQLTNDVTTLDSSQARLAGFCSAKGRLQASFVMWKPAHDEVLLACSASVLPATLKRLSMFVLRSQCKLGDASAELAMTGVAGDNARALVGDMPAWAVRNTPAGALLRLPDAAGAARCIVVAAPDAAPVQAPPLPLDLWRWLDVQSGIPTIEAATADQFVPQMLNYELVGGVDFHKGCYPGQEVVARSQYRGTVKRRMHLFDCDAPALPGQEVFHSRDADQPAGMVVNAAPRPEGAGSSALIEVKLAALGEGTLHLGAADGAALLLRALPYPLPAPELPVAPAA